MEKNQDMPLVRYSVAGGVVIHDGQILLLDRFSREEMRLPKGHVEAGETAEETALREVCEETGYADLRVLAELGSQQVEFVDPYKQRRVSRHDTYFLLGLASQAQVERGESGHKFVPIWVPLDQAAQRLTFEAEREFLRRALDLIRR